MLQPLSRPRRRADRAAAPRVRAVRRARRARRGVRRGVRRADGARTVHALRRLHALRARRPSSDRAASTPTTKRVEVRTLNESFNQLMDSIGGKRRAARGADRGAGGGERRAHRRDQRAHSHRAGAARERGAAAPVAEARGDRHARGRHRARLQQSHHRHLGLHAARAHAHRQDELRRRTICGRWSTRPTAPRISRINCSPSAASRCCSRRCSILSDVVSGIAPMLRRIIGEHIELRIENPAAARARARGPRTARAGAAQPRRERARRDAGAAAALTIATRNATASADRGDRARRRARRARHRHRHDATR